MQCPKCGEPILLHKIEITPIVDVLKKRRFYVLVNIYLCANCQGQMRFKQEHEFLGSLESLVSDCSLIIKDANDAFVYFDDQHKDVKTAVFFLKGQQSENDNTTEM